MRPDSDEPADRDLQALLETLNPKARDDLRRVLIRDQADRDAIASQLLPYGDQRGNDWADIIDMLTMHPNEGGAWRGCSARSRPPGRASASMDGCERR